MKGIKALYLAVFLGVFLFLLPMVAQAASITAGGEICTDTTWTKDSGTYYVTRTITVPAGVTLTVEPGVVVKFARNQGIIVNGSLVAVGLPADLIYFTDYRDDTVGGDTNGDGSATSPQAGWRSGIFVLSGGSATMEYTVVYGGQYYNGSEARARPTSMTIPAG